MVIGVVLRFSRFRCTYMYEDEFRNVIDIYFEANLGNALLPDVTGQPNAEVHLRL